MSQIIGVTGGAGRLGRGATIALTNAGFRVRSIDRVANPRAAENAVGDVREAAFIRTATAGLAGLVHLAATPDDDDFHAKLLPNNLAALYELLEACQANRVPRLFIASTGQVNWFHARNGPWPVKVGDPLTPKSWYAATKAFAESAGYSYHAATGADVVVGRLGWCPRDEGQVRELQETQRDRDLYLSARDFGAFLKGMFEAPAGFGYVICYVTSQPTVQARFDQTDIEKRFNYKPRDRWPEGLWEE